MNVKELNELVTKQDLVEVKAELTSIRLILYKINQEKEFYTTKEFAKITGIPYSTVVYKCSMGKLKAHQETENGSWLIIASEIERLKNLANKNLDIHE